MADRERSKDRPAIQPGTSHSQSNAQGSSSGSAAGREGGGGGGLSFLPNLFGRRVASSAPSTKSSESRSSSKQIEHRRESLDDSLISKTATTTTETSTIASFDLATALSLMEPGATKTVSELAEIVKATSVWLANLLAEKGDLFTPASPVEQPPAIDTKDLRTLYIRAFSFAEPKSDYTLRTASIRLLAALVATCPPPKSVIEPGIEGVNLPPSINPRSIYQLITSPSGGTPGTAQNDQLFVEVGTLKALSRNGRCVDGMEGIVGWLLKSLIRLRTDWLIWCGKRDDIGALGDEEKGKPFLPIRPASPAEAASCVLDLINAIVHHHVGLFSTANLCTIMRQCLEFFWAGLLTLRPEPPSTATVATGAAARNSPSSTALNSPATSSVPLISDAGGSFSVRRSTSIRNNRPRKDTGSSFGSGTPTMTSRALRQSFSAANTMTTASSPHSVNQVQSPSIHLSQTAPRWTRALPSLCALINTYIQETSVPDDLFDEILEFLCFCFGQTDADSLVESAWSSAYEVVLLMLSPKSGRRGELGLRKLLEGKLQTKFEGRKSVDVERKVTRGAVIVARHSMQHLDQIFQMDGSGSGGGGAGGTGGAGAGGEGSHSNLSLVRLAPSLVAAQSTSRFPGNGRTAEWIKWATVDNEILFLLQDHLFYLESGKIDRNIVDDAWTEGEAACEILNGMLPVIANVINCSFLPTFDSIVHQLPNAVGQLYASSSNKPIFYHPKYINLLLDLELDEEDANVVIDYYQRECLCLPFTSGWIRNIWKLIEAFERGNSSGSGNHLRGARNRVTNMLFDDIYKYVEDSTEYRAQLVEEVIIPFLEKALPEENDDVIVSRALDVLVSAAVAETMEKDEERRRVRASKDQSEVDAEDAAALPSDEIKAALSGGSFDSIRSLIIKLATDSICRYPQTNSNKSQIPSSSMGHVASATWTEGVSGHAQSRSRDQAAAASLRTIMGTLSPTQRSKELPVLSGLSSPISPTSSEDPSSSLPQSSSSPNAQQQQQRSSSSSSSFPVQPHANCKSLRAIAALIAIFTRLSFSLPQTIGGGSYSRTARTPASSRSITVYRDLLHLLFPMTDDVMAKMAARCPRARILVLQWSMRLRADRKHRIYFRSDITRFIAPFAAALYRTKETEAEVRNALQNEEARRRRPPGQGVSGWAEAATVSSSTVGVDEGRGRAPRNADQTSRNRSSRSRSKAPIVSSSTDTKSYDPLWCLPETLPCELPPDMHPSEGMTTYDPDHPSLRDKDAPPLEGVWLPVSEYVRVLNGILRWEHDWEIVSYVLCHIPLQLGNKYFFHGRRATSEIKKLLKVLCEGVLATENRWEKRFHIPAFIKRYHINAAAYASISVLISYRGVFDRIECDTLVASLVAGLEGVAMLAKPCLQSLTVCIFELEQYVAKHLRTIIEKTQQILSTPAVAVHILEFLIALGHTPALYRNFTDDQYRLVFAVSVGYIAEHNARSDTPSESFNQSSTAREAFTLSQHVIGLAYHTIYVWFMALRIVERPRHVSELTRGLLSAKSQRTPVDERAEVCFDWLARYAYGNADPRPATSFLSEVVMQNDKEKASTISSSGNNGGSEIKSMSWLLGGAIVTIKSHLRSGWATISTTRPTGSTAIVCKLENIPLLEIGEADADLVSLPAFLMANRELKQDWLENRKDGEGERTVTAERQDVEDGKVVRDKLAAEIEKDSSLTEHALQLSIKGDANLASSSIDPRAIVSVKSPVPPAGDFDSTSLQGYIWSGATPSQRRKDVSIEPSFLALQLLSSYPNASLDTPRGRLIPKDPKFERALRGIDNTVVIDTCKIAVLYVGPGQKNETEIFGNVDGSPLYLDFLAGLGRIIRLKGQVDVFTGGLDRENDTDGAYAYAWWDDLSQMIFHAPTMMPNLPHEPEFANKKRLVGNDFVKIVYNESGTDFAFDTVKTAFNFVNIVISPHAISDGSVGGGVSTVLNALGASAANARSSIAGGGEWADDGEDFFKVTIQRAPGIPEFSPIGEHKLVSRKTLPVLVRQIAHHANDMAARFMHIRQAPDAQSAEYITSWRSRLRAINRIREMLPPIELPSDPGAKEELLRDFTRVFSSQAE